MPFLKKTYLEPLSTTTPLDVDDIKDCVDRWIRQVQVHKTTLKQMCEPMVENHNADEIKRKRDQLTKCIAGNESQLRLNEDLLKLIVDGNEHYPENTRDKTYMGISGYIREYLAAGRSPLWQIARTVLGPKGLDKLGSRRQSLFQQVGLALDANLFIRRCDKKRVESIIDRLKLELRVDRAVLAYTEAQGQNASSVAWSFQMLDIIEQLCRNSIKQQSSVTDNIFAYIMTTVQLYNRFMVSVIYDTNYVKQYAVQCCSVMHRIFHLRRSIMEAQYYLTQNVPHIKRLNPDIHNAWFDHLQTFEQMSDYSQSEWEQKEKQSKQELTEICSTFYDYNRRVQNETLNFYRIHEMCRDLVSDVQSNKGQENSLRIATNYLKQVSK